MNDLKTTITDGMSLYDLWKAIVAGEKGFALNDPTGAMLDAMSVILDIIATVSDYEASLTVLKQAEADYLEAYHRYQTAYYAWLKANNCDNCPPQPPTKTAEPNHPTHGTGQNNLDNHSNDPNDKLSSGAGGAGFVLLGQPITYTIDFENQASATAPAQTVSITDPLDPGLDWSTVQLGAIGFNNVVIPVLPGLQFFTTNVSVSTDPNPVRVTASLNATNGILSWEMESIDPVTGLLVTDPAAGFLPPDNAAGLGYVSFSAQPRSGLGLRHSHHQPGQHRLRRERSHGHGHHDQHARRQRTGFLGHDAACQCRGHQPRVVLGRHR